MRLREHTKEILTEETISKRNLHQLWTILMGSGDAGHAYPIQDSLIIKAVMDVMLLNGCVVLIPHTADWRTCTMPRLLGSALVTNIHYKSARGISWRR
ncbi:hypothetical protein E2C01_094473 [Portunus trituberculatus]|uniref:Uncharacterized protein n=1 Tax=Portunus trituberculatus TaxID=210409 RepID=A0A5B7K1R5_PORTR|nr:hypothetical protein [Portunus trituberculatus]